VTATVVAHRPRALIDVNVVLDVLQRREPHFYDSACVMGAAETGRCRGLVAAHSVTTLFYLLARHDSPGAARVHLTSLLQYLDVAPVDGGVVQRSLALPYADLEDAVQMMAAASSGADFVVTRNTGDFAAGPLPAVNPAEFMALLDWPLED